jgi:poly-gamma-glutamate synthesis protein (capsule biosynthesis protein)
MRIIVHKKHKLLIAVLILLVGLISVLAYIIFTPEKDVLNKGEAKTSVNTDRTAEKNIINFAAMGDMLAHDTIISNAKSGDSYDFAKYFKNIRPSYNDADLVFCNQEGLSAGESYGISGYPSFNAPTKFSADLKSGAGCNLINLANNHMGDKGTAAINATIDNWTDLKPLAFAGANKSADDQEKVSYATVNGIKISFLSFADFNNNKSTPAYAINLYHDESLVRRLVTEARNNSDVVIVSMHWGVEDSNSVSDDQLAAADLLNDLGVDIVVGTGPHVLQMMQTVYRASDNFKTYVWYSLGNMLSSQLQTRELIGGIAKMKIEKNNGKISISNLGFSPTYMHYEWTATDAANGDLSARKNAMIYLLKDAADPLSRSQLHTTVDNQWQYVVDTIGSEVTVK